MSVAFRGVGAVSTRELFPLSGTNIDVSFPANVQTGDVCILTVSSPQGANMTGPSGWTEFAAEAAASSAANERVYWRRSVGGESGSSTSVPISNPSGGSTSVSVHAYIAAYSGVALNGNPIAHAVNWTPAASLTLDTSVLRAPIASLTGPIVTTYGGESWPGLTGVSGLERVNSAGVLLYTATAATGTSSAFTFTNASGGYDGHLYDLLPALAPYAPTPTAPVSGATLARDVTQRFQWTFSAPDPLETQSHYDIQYRQGAGAWQTISGSTPNSYIDIAAGTFAAGSYEWQVRTTGQLGQASAWSASAFFTAINSPAGPTITAPTNNSTVSLSQQTVTWSTPSQTAYEVRRVADNAGAPNTGTVYWTSGQVVSATTRSLVVPFPVNSRAEHVQIAVQSGGIWSPFTDARVLVSYTQPHTPALVVTSDLTTGSFLLTITDPTPTGTEPGVVSVDVYRSENGGPLERVAAGLPPSTPWRYWLPAFGIDYAFMVRANGANGITADSAVVTIADAQTITTAGRKPGYLGGYLGGY